MPQLFSNNAETTLAAPLTDSATSISFADGSLFQSPTGGDFEILTLLAAGSFEIVRLTARTGNTGTITRAQEGTAAAAWASGTTVFAGVTAGSLAALASGGANAKPVVIGAGATAGHSGDTIVGEGATGTGTGANKTAVGKGATVSASFGSAFGSGASASGGSSLAAGTATSATGSRSAAIGALCQASAISALALGDEAWAQGYASVAITLGISERAHVLNVGALPAAISLANHALYWGNEFTFSNGGTMEAVVISDEINLKATGTITCPVLAGGVTFYADEVGVIISEASGVTGQPELSFGITGNNTKMLAATATTGLDAAKKRQRFSTLLSHDGETSYTATVAAAATGTTLKGRVYWRGFAVQDNA